MDKLDSGNRDLGKRYPDMDDPAMHDPAMHDPDRHDPAMHDPDRHDPDRHDPGCGRRGRRHFAAWPVARAAVAAAALLLPLAGGCSTDAGETRYPDVASLGRELTEAGLECELEYEGLEDGSREVSTCRIDGEFSLLQIWRDEKLLAEFLESSDPPELPQAVGPNWIVDVETEGTARRVAETLGGTMRASPEQ